LLFNEDHCFSFTFLYPFLLQFLAGVHFAGGPHLASTHLTKSSFAQNTVHSESFVRYRLAVGGEMVDQQNGK
jgi:hypothetical protein